jgi:hypothetical protein
MNNLSSNIVRLDLYITQYIIDIQHPFWLCVTPENYNAGHLQPLFLTFYFQSFQFLTVLLFNNLAVILCIFIQQIYYTYTTFNLVNLLCHGQLRSTLVPFLELCQNIFRWCVVWVVQPITLSLPTQAGKTVQSR